MSTVMLSSVSGKSVCKPEDYRAIVGRMGKGSISTEKCSRVTGIVVLCNLM